MAQGNEAFAELAPAAVAVWDRLLGYGVAVGAAPAAADAVGLEVGARDVLRSDFTGSRRDVQVRYPGRNERRYPVPAGARLAGSLFWLALTGLLWLAVGDDVARLAEPASAAVYAATIVVLAWSLYRGDGRSRILLRRSR